MPLESHRPDVAMRIRFSILMNVRNKKQYSIFFKFIQLTLSFNDRSLKKKNNQNWES